MHLLLGTVQTDAVLLVMKKTVLGGMMDQEVDESTETCSTLVMARIRILS